MKNYQFKLGQQYKVIKSNTHYFIEGKCYNVVKFNYLDDYVLESESNLYFAQKDFDNPSYVSYNVELELVADSKEQPFTPTIEIDFLIDYILDKGLTSNEIVAFLKGHNKGQVFIHENLK